MDRERESEIERYKEERGGGEIKRASEGRRGEMERLCE